MVQEELGRVQGLLLKHESEGLTQNHESSDRVIRYAHHSVCMGPVGSTRM